MPMIITRHMAVIILPIAAAIIRRVPEDIIHPITETAIMAGAIAEGITGATVIEDSGRTNAQLSWILPHRHRAGG